MGHHIIFDFREIAKENITIAEKMIKCVDIYSNRKFKWKKKDREKRQDFLKKKSHENYKKFKFELMHGTYSTLEKKCKKCGEIKSVFDFTKKKEKQIRIEKMPRAKGRYSMCRECCVKKSQKYALENPEKIKISRKIENQKYHRKIGRRLRLKLWKAIRFYKLQKKQSAIKYLGCSIEDFMKYLENLFTDGMNWDKLMRGEIHIDHIIPFCSVDLSIEENRYKVCHFTNLRPLWAKDNWAKMGNDRKKSIHKNTVKQHYSKFK